MNMTTAPKDGTRILIKHHCMLWSQRGNKRTKQGTAISECYWGGEKWEIWCGNERTKSTEYVDPISWAPIPEELKG